LLLSSPATTKDPSRVPNNKTQTKSDREIPAPPSHPLNSHRRSPTRPGTNTQEKPLNRSLSRSQRLVIIHQPQPYSRARLFFFVSEDPPSLPPLGRAWSKMRSSSSSVADPPSSLRRSLFIFLLLALFFLFVCDMEQPTVMWVHAERGVETWSGLPWGEDGRGETLSDRWVGGGFRVTCGA